MKWRNKFICHGLVALERQSLGVSRIRYPGYYPRSSVEVSCLSWHCNGYNATMTSDTMDTLCLRPLGSVLPCQGIRDLIDYRHRLTVRIAHCTLHNIEHTRRKQPYAVKTHKWLQRSTSSSTVRVLRLCCCLGWMPQLTPSPVVIHHNYQVTFAVSVRLNGQLPFQRPSLTS